MNPQPRGTPVPTCRRRLRGRCPKLPPSPFSPLLSRLALPRLPLALHCCQPFLFEKAQLCQAMPSRTPRLVKRSPTYLHGRRREMFSYHRPSKITRYKLAEVLALVRKTLGPTHMDVCHCQVGFLSKVLLISCRVFPGLSLARLAHGECYPAWIKLSLPVRDSLSVAAKKRRRWTWPP